MAQTELYRKYPELEEIISLIKYEMQLQTRPPDQVILDDVDLRNLLRVSKRTTQTWRDTGMISYSKPGKIYYKLSNVLEMLDAHETPAINSEIKKSVKNLGKGISPKF